MEHLHARSFIRTLFKILLLSLLIGLDIFCIYTDAYHIQSFGFEENGFVEWWQQIQLAITIIALCLNIRKNEITQPLFMLMAGTLSCFLIREFNNFLSDNLFPGAWTTLVIICAGITLYRVYKKRSNLLAALYHFSITPSFGITVSGFIFLFIFSRVMGIPNLWHLALGNNYIRYAERMAEESLELVGYSIMLFGILSYVTSVKRLKQLACTEQPFNFRANKFHPV